MRKDKENPYLSERKRIQEVLPIHTYSVYRGSLNTPTMRQQAHMHESKVLDTMVKGRLKKNK